MNPKKKSNQFLCIHGHFYQPPRENPWIEVIEVQKSAEPYHDWNERVTRECYGPNSRGRLMGKENRIQKLINNYEYMSFNFGPTLLTWLEEKHPWIYSQIIKADMLSQERYMGHGNAIAQVYNHIIMPLASRRDKITQILWGIVDFKHRFGRNPEGMWLAETAVDNESLYLMAKEGIKFTILSPTQAKSIRPIKSNLDKSGDKQEADKWQDVSGGKIDPACPYRVMLSQKENIFIDVFFYDGPLSRSIAYEKVLNSGEELMTRIKSIFRNNNDGPHLVSIATDGESYGHHFKFGEMALSWLFDHVEHNENIRLTNFGMFLEQFPPEMEVRIVENSAWSCSHGVERWRSDCGCNVGHRQGWNQKWRRPLREGLEWLLNELSIIYENQSRGFLRDPWAARNDYIKVILDNSKDCLEDFFQSHSERTLNKQEENKVIQLLESQRMSLYMFTSCGWFFDDISGIEAGQVLMYAARAIDLVSEWSSSNLENGLIKFLNQAKSNDPTFEHGGKIYETITKHSQIDPPSVSAHYGLTLLLLKHLPAAWPFNGMIHIIHEQDFQDQELNAKIGNIMSIEKRTGRESRKCYLAYREGKNLPVCLVGSPPNDNALFDQIREHSDGLSYELIVAIFTRNCHETRKYTLKDLIPEARKFITEGLSNKLNITLNGLFKEREYLIEDFIILMNEANEQPTDNLKKIFPLLFLQRLFDQLSPEYTATEIDLSYLHDLSQFCDPSSCDILTKNPVLLEFLHKQMIHFRDSEEISFIDSIIKILNLVRTLKIEPDLWELQNLYYDLREDPGFLNRLGHDILSLFMELGHKLGFVSNEAGV